MSYVDNIVSRFRTLAALSRLTGKPYSTCKSWRDRGSIPDEHKPDVLKAALDNGIPLEPADFFPEHVGGDSEAAR